MQNQLFVYNIFTVGDIKHLSLITTVLNQHCFWIFYNKTTIYSLVIETSYVLWLSIIPTLNNLIEFSVK